MQLWKWKGQNSKFKPINLKQSQPYSKDGKLPERPPKGILDSC